MTFPALPAIWNSMNKFQLFIRSHWQDQLEIWLVELGWWQDRWGVQDRWAVEDDFNDWIQWQWIELIVGLNLQDRLRASQPPSARFGVPCRVTSFPLPWIDPSQNQILGQERRDTAQRNAHRRTASVISFDPVKKKILIQDCTIFSKAFGLSWLLLLVLLSILRGSLSRTLSVSWSCKRILIGDRFK